MTKRELGRIVTTNTSNFRQLTQADRLYFRYSRNLQLPREIQRYDNCAPGDPALESLVETTFRSLRCNPCLTLLPGERSVISDGILY